MKESALTLGKEGSFGVNEQNTVDGGCDEKKALLVWSYSIGL